MDAFKLLKTDHRTVADLFKQLERSNENQKLEVFAQIKMELDLHAHIEEKIFYPALEEPTETRDLTLEAYEEHKQVKTLLRELSRGRKANDEWQAKAKVLQESVEHHVQEEENELFSQARAALSDEEIMELGSQMALEKERMQGRAGAKSSASKSARSSSAKKSTKSSGSKKSSSSKKASGKKKPASKAAKKTGGSKKRGRGKSARATK